MVLRHSLSYLLMRGGPALLNLAALFLFTRLLPPQEFGRYALVLAGVSLANAAFFWWLQLALLRFLPRYRQRRPELVSALAAGYIGTLLATLPVALLVAALRDRLELDLRLVALGTVLLWAGAWHDLNLEMARSDLSPRRYGMLLTGRSLLFIIVGAVLALAGFGAEALLLGAAAAAIVPALTVLRSHWGGVARTLVRREMLQDLLRYGMPLVLTSALMLIVNVSDRFFLGWLGDHRTVGVYSAGYDLAQSSLGALMNVVYLAFFPLAIRAFEDGSESAARTTLSTGCSVLLAVGVPGAVGLALLAPDVTHLLLGRDYQSAAAVIPWVAAAAFLGSMKAFYFDLSYQLAKRTRVQLGIALATAALNLLLNFSWIPRFGMLGAAVATTVSFVFGTALSAALGHRAFRLPFPVADAVRVLAAAAALAAVLLATRGGPASVGLVALRAVAASLAYGALLLALDTLSMRTRLLRAWRKRPDGAAATAFQNAAEDVS